MQQGEACFWKSSPARNVAAELAEAGIVVGVKMYVKRRITVYYDTKTKLRKDVPAGTEVSVQSGTKASLVKGPKCPRGRGRRHPW